MLKLLLESGSFRLAMWPFTQRRINLISKNRTRASVSWKLKPGSDTHHALSYYKCRLIKKRFPESHSLLPLKGQMSGRRCVPLTKHARTHPNDSPEVRGVWRNWFWPWCLTFWCSARGPISQWPDLSSASAAPPVAHSYPTWCAGRTWSPACCSLQHPLHFLRWVSSATRARGGAPLRRPRHPRARSCAHVHSIYFHSRAILIFFRFEGYKSKKKNQSGSLFIILNFYPHLS